MVWHMYFSYAVVRKHRNINNAYKYLKMMYKKPRKSYDTYEKLSRRIMYEWFTSIRELKDAYKKYVDEESSHFQGEYQHCPILSNHQELKEAIIEMLHAYKKAGQPFYVRSIRNLIIHFIQRGLHIYLFKKVQLHSRCLLVGRGHLLENS